MREQRSFFHALIAVFGGTLTVQVLAFFRQVVFASLYGADRTVDVYLLVVSIAAISVFIFSFVIENASVPPLVACRTAGDFVGFDRLASCLFSLSLAMGAGLGTIFMVLVPFATPIVGAGLTSIERARLVGMSWYLLPWVLLVVPFYALSAIHKARHHFSRFLIAEVLTVVVSLVLILIWHPTVETTALAYGAGYAVGILTLLPGANVRLCVPPAGDPGLAALARPIIQLTASTMVASAGSLADRFVQSFLPAGGIAANTYSGLIIASTSTLLGFRDIFLVPFAEPNDRGLKLERALIGLSLLAIPAGVFLSIEAHAIIAALFERGRFGATATAQSAQLLQILACSLLSGALASPMFRMLQVINKVQLGTVVYVVSAGCTLFFGGVFVLWLGWGLPGYAVATLLGSYATMGTTALFVARSGIVVDWLRVIRYGAYALGASLVAAAATVICPDWGYPFITLALKGLVFGMVLMAFYGAIYKRLLWIIRQR